MFKRRRFKQTQSFEQRLIEEAAKLRNEARETAPGAERESLMRRARQAETASHMRE
jgi:hypothetical protein